MRFWTRVVGSLPFRSSSTARPNWEVTSVALCASIMRNAGRDQTPCKFRCFKYLQGGKKAKKNQGAGGSEEDDEE